MNRICNAGNTKIDEKNYLKGKTVCKNRHNKNRRKSNDNTLMQNQQPKIEKVNNNKNIRTLIIGFSNCVKIYLMNNVLLRKQEPIYIFTKALNQNFSIKAQTSDEMQPLENYENSTVAFDD